MKRVLTYGTYDLLHYGHIRLLKRAKELGDYLIVGWKVGYQWEYGEKCDKCDNDRKIHFTSPQGKEYKEDIYFRDFVNALYPHTKDISDDLYEDMKHLFLQRIKGRSRKS